MNRLLIQFIVISTLPLSLAALILYTWRRKPERRKLAVAWTVTILAAAVWASSLLTQYLGANVADAVGFTWRVAGNYALSLTGPLLLITTTIYLSKPEWQQRRFFGLCVALWLAAVGLDPAVWFSVYRMPTVSISGLTVRQFDIWALVWVTSWALPALTAWVRTEQALRDVPRSLYRSQVTYWFVTVTTFGVGGILALMRGSLLSQQFGAMFLILSGLLGAVGITRHQLADLQGKLRFYLINAARGLVVFVLAWGGLAVITFFLTGAMVQNAVLIVATAIFAVLILVVLTVVDRLSSRFLDRDVGKRVDDLAQHLDIGNSLLKPEELAGLYLRLLKIQLGVEGLLWMMETADAPGGGLMLCPLAQVGNGREKLTPAVLSAGNPFVDYVRHSTKPLVQQDIDALSAFKDMDASERRRIAAWERSLYVPVHAGNRLIALIGLQEKSGGDPYSASDFTYLRAFAAQVGRLLTQSRNFYALSRVNEHVFRQNMILGHEKRRLDELVNLHGQFTELMSPDLRRPFTDLELAIQKMQEHTGNGHGPQNGQAVLPTTMRAHVDEAQAMVDNLIAVASHLEKQHQFNFKPLYVDAVLRTAMRNLEGMAEARRVVVILDVRGKLLPVYGDEERLTEAVQQLLHNALKFNRIGGEVRITCEMWRNELRIQIVDNGVGIPEEKMPEIWTGLTKLFGNPHGLRRRTRVGLPLVRFIVQSHGGRIDAESSYGHGCTFTLYLPALLESDE